MPYSSVTVALLAASPSVAIEIVAVAARCRTSVMSTATSGSPTAVVVNVIVADVPTLPAWFTARTRR